MEQNNIVLGSYMEDILDENIAIDADLFDAELANMINTIVRASSAKQAESITVFDVRGKFPLSDVFIVVSACNLRQVLAIVDFVDEHMHKQGFVARNKEGLEECNWVLVDYGAVILHVQLEEDRALYNLDDLWSSLPKYVLKENKFISENVGV